MFYLTFEQHEYPAEKDWKRLGGNLSIDTERPPAFAVKQISDDLYGPREEKQKTHLFEDGIRGQGSNVDLGDKLPRVKVNKLDNRFIVEVPGFFEKPNYVAAELEVATKSGAIKLSDLFSDNRESKIPLFRYLGFLEASTGMDEDEIPIHDLELLWRNGGKLPGVREKLKASIEEIARRPVKKYVAPVTFRGDTYIPSEKDRLEEEVSKKMNDNYKDIAGAFDTYSSVSTLVRDVISDVRYVKKSEKKSGIFRNYDEEVEYFELTKEVFRENEFATDFIRNHLLTSTLIYHGMAISDKTVLDRCTTLHTLRATALSEVLKFVYELEAKYEFNFGDIDPSRIAMRFLIHEVTSGGLLIPYYGNLVEDVVNKILVWHPVPYFDFTTLANISGSVMNQATGGRLVFTSRMNGRNRKPTLIDKIFDNTLNGRFSAAVDSLDKDFSGLQGNNVPMLITRLMYTTGLVYDASQFRHLFYLLYLDQSYLNNLKKSGSFKFLDEHVWGETNNALISITNTLSKARGKDARLLQSKDKAYLRESELSAEFFLSFPASTSTNYLMNGTKLAEELMRVNRQILEGWGHLNSPSKLCVHNSFYRGDMSLIVNALARSAYVSGVGNITRRGKVPITLESNAVLSLVKNSNNIRELLASRTNDNDWWDKLMAVSNMPMEDGAWPIITKAAISGDKSLIAAGKGGGEIYIVARPKNPSSAKKDKEDNMSAYMWLKYIHNLYEFMTADSPGFDIYKLPGMFLEFEADVRAKLLDYAGQLQEVTISAIKSSIEKWFNYVDTLLIHLRTDYDIKVRKQLTAMEGGEKAGALLKEHEKIYLVFTAAMDMMSTLRVTILHMMNVVLYEYLRLPPIPPTTPLPIKSMANVTFGVPLGFNGGVGGGGGNNTAIGLVSDLLNTIPNERKYAVAAEILGKLPVAQEEASTYENIFKVYQTALMFSSTTENRKEVTELFDKHVSRLVEIDEKVTTLEVRALSVVSSIERATRLSNIVTRTVRKTMSVYDILSFLVPKLPTRVEVWVVEDAPSLPQDGARRASITRGVADALSGDKPLGLIPLYPGELNVGFDEWTPTGSVAEFPLDRLVEVKNGKLVEEKNPLVDPSQYELLALKTFPVEPHSNEDSLKQQLLRIRENQDKINERREEHQTYHTVHGELKTSETQTEVLISLMASRLYTEGISPHFVEVTGAFTTSVGSSSRSSSRGASLVLEKDATDAVSGEKWSPLTILRRILQGEENLLDIARDVGSQPNGGELMKKTRDIYEIIGEKTEVIDNNLNLIISLISDGTAAVEATEIDGTQSFIVMELIDRDMSKMRDIYELLYKNVYRNIASTTGGDEDVPSYSECVENAVQQVVIALALFQHELKGMHRDLHPGNVFVKVCDIKQFQGKSLRDVPRLETRIGRRVYSLPNLGFVCKLADYGLSTISWESPDHVACVDVQTDYVSPGKSKIYFDPLRDMPVESVVSQVVKEYMNTLNMVKFFSLIASMTDDLVKKRLAALIENTGGTDKITETTGFIYTLSSMFVDIIPTSILSTGVVSTLEVAQEVVKNLAKWAGSIKITDIGFKSMLKLIAVAGVVLGIGGATSWITSLSLDSVTEATNVIITGIATIVNSLSAAGTTLGVLGSAASIWKWATGGGGGSGVVSGLLDWAVGITATSLVGKALVPFLWERVVDQYIAPLTAAKLKIPEQVDQLFKPIDFRKTRRYTPGYDIATFFNGVANNPQTWTCQTIKYYYEMERAAHLRRFGTDEHVQFYQINDPKYTFPIHTMGNNVVSHFYPDSKWTLVSPMDFLQRMVEMTQSHGERGIYYSELPLTAGGGLSTTPLMGNALLSTDVLTCQWCNLREAQFICTQCEKSIYCSEECASNDWSHCGTHSYSCRATFS